MMGLVGVTVPGLVEGTVTIVGAVGPFGEGKTVVSCKIVLRPYKSFLRNEGRLTCPESSLKDASLIFIPGNSTNDWTN